MDLCCRSIFLIVLIVSGSLIAQASNMSLSMPCAVNPKIQKQRSDELQKLYATDQGDRKEIEEHPDRPWPPEKMITMSKNDLKRRKRVGEIFAEGCINTAADYKAAAMIYQHGTYPDHFYQTFIWSKRGVDLGDQKQNSMVGLGLDRYLVNSKHKQLFASQARKMNGSECWCLQPIEESFPDVIRLQYTGKTKADKIDWLKSMNVGHTCPDIECKMDELKPTPKGSVPGFW